MQRLKKCFSFILLLVIIAGALAGCNSVKDESFDKIEDFEQAKIGVLTGSSFDMLAKEYLPEAERLSYINMPDLIVNLKQNKIDGILMDMGFFTPLMWEGKSLSYVEMDMPATEYAIAFPKTEKSELLKAQVDEFIRTQTENGWLDELKAKWFAKSEPDGSIDFSSLTGKNGTLRVATTAESKPFDYAKNGQFCGMDADFIFQFAKEYGYALEIDIIDFGALLPGLSTERYDLAISSITVTEERKESVLFSDIYFSSDIVMAVMAEEEEPETKQSISDFATAKIGIITGSSHDLTAKTVFPEAERIYFNSMADMVLAVEQGKVDCYLEDEAFVTILKWEGLALKPIEEPVFQVKSGFVFPKGEESLALREEVNAFLAKAKADGTIEELKEKWLGEKEPEEHPDYKSLTGENGTIKVAISVDNKPLLYQNAEGFTGLEIEILTLFAQEYGYAFDFEVVTFESIIAGIYSGKYDMGASALNITPERMESVDFSDPYTDFNVVLITKDEEKQEHKMTLADIENKTIGIVTGTSWDVVAQKKFPNAERKYFSSIADVMLALEQGKVDTLFADKTVYAGMRWDNPAIDAIDEPIETICNALILAKEGYDENLLNQINEFVAKSKENGTLEKFDKKWFGSSEPEEHPDYTKLTGENGTIKVAIGDSMKPTAYRKGSMYTGYEVEFLTLFAEEYGYKLDMQGMAFEALIPAVTSKKCDIGACGITVTPERAESVTFADSHFETYGVAIIRSSSVEKSKKTLADFEDATIGILSGSSFDPLAREHFPNAERQYFSLLTDMLIAVEMGKIDGYISETTYFSAARWEGANIEYIEEPIATTQAGYIFRKDTDKAEVREQLNEFLIGAKESGLLEGLNEKWLSDKEPTEFFDSSSLTGENGTLKVAVSPDLKPLSYVRGNEMVGYEVEVLQHFAKEYGYKLEFTGMTFDAILPGIVSGKYDIGAGGMTITEERKQSVDFTESYLTVDVVMVVKADDVASETGFLAEIKEDFNKTFIREDRWKLIVQGIGITMLISLCSAVLGSMLGFGLYMLSRSDVKPVQKLTKGIAKIYSRIVAGTPVVVILMILFYVVFGKLQDMSGVVVAIIGFTLTFGAFVYDHMVVSVTSVGRDQMEAAYALGYTKNQTFFRIIFPQAMSIFLPSYCSQAVELIKATAVVGYIAVNDLTKIGDIIRSNTYEAFFPLIATAIIYFILTWILSTLLGFLKKRFEPKRRSKEDILKGVKTV